MMNRTMALSTFRVTPREWAFSTAYAAAIILVLGTFTALWQNPWFFRMTPVGPWDYVILGLEGTLLGLYLGVRVTGCGIKRATFGGVLGFLGFGCSICNKLLMLVFGAGFLLTYFEPVRYPIGAVGVAVLGFALYKKLSLRATSP